MRLPTPSSSSAENPAPRGIRQEQARSELEPVDRPSPSLPTARRRAMRRRYRDRHLVQVPAVGGARAQPAQVAGEDGLELQAPAPDGFVAGLDAALGRAFLDVAGAKHETGSGAPCRMISGGTWRRAATACMPRPRYPPAGCLVPG